jgi:hypothetical protein
VVPPASSATKMVCAEAAEAAVSRERTFMMGWGGEVGIPRAVRWEMGGMGGEVS